MSITVHTSLSSVAIGSVDPTSDSEIERATQTIAAHSRTPVDSHELLDRMGDEQFIVATAGGFAKAAVSYTSVARERLLDYMSPGAYSALTKKLPDWRRVGLINTVALSSDVQASGQLLVAALEALKASGTQGTLMFGWMGKRSGANITQAAAHASMSVLGDINNFWVSETPAFGSGCQECDSKCFCAARVFVRQF